MAEFRGSREHILAWRQASEFQAELNALLEPSGVRVGNLDTVLPVSRSHPAEARLESYGPRFLGDAIDWSALRAWWLRHPVGANTPNWDLAAVGHRGKRPALVLFEAKANVPELSAAGKPLSRAAKVRSMENDLQIRSAIEEACGGWRSLSASVHLSHAAHYQLSNRLAFTWKLTSLGLDVVLVYLGFLGDSGITDAGEPFKDDHHWRRVFWGHARSVVPESLFERELLFGSGSAWCLLRSLPCRAPSRPRHRRLPN